MNMNSNNRSLRITSPARRLGNFGILSAIVSLLLLSEVFGSVAIILGAYAWKEEPDSSLGLIALILGIICMLVGIYFTAYPLLYDLIFPY